MFGVRLGTKDASVYVVVFFMEVGNKPFKRVDLVVELRNLTFQKFNLTAESSCLGVFKERSVKNNANSTDNEPCKQVAQ